MSNEEGRATGNKGAGPQTGAEAVLFGLKNSGMGVINAASDNVPVGVLSGRTPITEAGRESSRVTPIQYGKEMYHQSSLVSDTVKYHYRCLAESGQADQMSGEWLSLCLSNIMHDNAVLFSELGVVSSAMQLAGPNRLFSNPHSGGLGWALPAAMGAQFADRERLCIACMGDGSYMFANPIACHQVCEAQSLPLLIVIKNNASWNAVRRSVVNTYPDGAAVKHNRMPLTSLEPIPDFTHAAMASRAYAQKVDRGEQLPTALERAVHIIRTERRQVLLDVKVAVSDSH